MNKTAVVGFLLLQFAAASAFAAPPFIKKTESTASESPSANGVVQTVVNTSFAFTNLYNAHKHDYVSGLISQQVETSTTSGRGSADPKLEAVAWVDGRGKYDSKLWSISDCADSGWQSGDYYWTSKYGGANGENMLHAYNLKDGKYVFSFTTDPVSVEVMVPKDTVKRALAYVSRTGADTACKKADLPDNAIGSLTIADDDSQLDRIVLESDNGTFGRSPKVLLVSSKDPKGAASLSLWGPAEFGKKSDVVKGFSIQLTYGDGTEVTIPVTNDKFDIGGAKLPSSIKLRRIDVEKVGK